MIRLLLRMILFGLLACSSTRNTVRAQPASPAAQRAQAKQHVDAGIAALQSGDYDAAIAQYHKAYELVPHPAVLFDIAQAYRLSGRLQLALGFYRRYLADAPDGEQAPIVRAFIAQLETELAKPAQANHDREAQGALRTGSPAEGTVAAGGSGPAQPAGVAQAAGSTEDTAAGAAHAPGGQAGEPALQTRRDASATAAREAPPSRPLRIAGLAAAGAGIVALAVGTGFGLHARSLSNQLQPGHTWNPDTYAAGRRADKIAIAGFISGGALIGTGAVLYWLGHAQDHGLKQPVVAPAVWDHGVSLVLLAPWP